MPANARAIAIREAARERAAVNSNIRLSPARISGVVKATRNVILDDANAVSMQLAAKFFGGDEYSNEMRRLIEKNPNEVTPRERGRLRDFLRMYNVRSVPRFDKVGLWYDDGRQRIEISKVNRSPRIVEDAKLMRKIANHALGFSGVFSLQAMNRQETELEVEFRPARGNEWAPSMQFRVGNRDNQLYCLLLAQNLDGDSLSIGDWYREKELRREVDRLGREAGWPKSLVKSLHNFLNTMGK